VIRHDYLPFGEEIQVNTGIRTTTNGYVGDGIRQKFTGKDRDAETGLDYFEARYYAGKQGRFTSPDEFSGGPDELFDFVDLATDNPTFYADLAEPQSLNKYQYWYNNPLHYVDADGHSGTVAGAVVGGIVGGAVAWWRGESVAKGALSGAVAGAIAGSIIDTGGASLGVIALAGAAGGVVGGTTHRTLHGQPTTLKDVAKDATIGAATGVVGGGVGRAITRVGQRVAGPSARFDTLRTGPYAKESVPATGPKVTASQRAKVGQSADKCHTCGSKSLDYVGDHQPSTGLAVRSSNQRLYRQCTECSGRQSSQVRQQNVIWRRQQQTGTAGGTGGSTAVVSTTNDRRW
jgi:RHS repeat-associated protein